MVMTKKELQNELIKLGYSKADFIVDGKPLKNSELEELLEKEQSIELLEEAPVFVPDVVEVVESKDELPDFFDMGVLAKSSQRFGDDDEIMIMCGINGAYSHHSNFTGRDYKFNGFGQTAKMPYKELITIKNLYSTVLDSGWIIILNKDIIEDFGLTEQYKTILTPKNIQDVFKKSSKEVKEFAKNLPKGMQVTFIDTAKQLYKNGKLDSKSVIDVVQESFDISLDDNAPISTTVKE